MKLVVDTSVLIAALTKDSAVRELLLNPLFEFYVPEHCIEEIEKHMGEITKRSGLIARAENKRSLHQTETYAVHEKLLISSSIRHERRLR